MSDRTATSLRRHPRAHRRRRRHPLRTPPRLPDPRGVGRDHEPGAAGRLVAAVRRRHHRRPPRGRRDGVRRPSGDEPVDDDVHDPARRAADAARAHPRRRPARTCGGSSSRSTTGCVLRLSHFVTDADARDRQLLRRRPAHLARPARALPRRPPVAVGLGRLRRGAGALRRASASQPPVTPTSMSAPIDRASCCECRTSCVSHGRVRRRRGPEPRAALRPRRPRRELVVVGRRHRELAEPHRPRRHPRARRLLHPRLRQQHRRRDHGPQQVRPAARPVGGPRLEGLVGRRRRRSTRRCSCSPTTSGPSFTLADTTFHFLDADARRGAAAGEGGRRRQGRAPRRRRRDRPRVPRRRPRRHDARRRRARSSSAAANASGTRPTSCSTASTSSAVPSPSGVTHLLFWRR